MADALATLPKTELVKRASQGDRYKLMMRRLRENQSEIGQTIARKASMSASAGLLGAAEAAYGEGAIFGADIPLVVGLVATTAEVFAAASGMDGTATSLVAGVADAGTSIVFYKGGARLYDDWRGRSESGASRE